MSSANDNPSKLAPPVSRVSGLAPELIQAGIMSAPVRPGLLGSLDRFDVLSPIGSGGMGIVFLARDAGTGQRVAVKLLRPELLEEERASQYFLNEAHHMQRLGHPHILPAMEICDDKDRPYFVMPVVEPGSLAKRMHPGRPLNEDFILSIAPQIAAALQHAHRKGIIHRDIKPSNVLIDASGHAWLSDFGLARSLLNPSLLDGEGVHLEGTTPYLSPQAACGEVEDTRGDIYAFGALLYEMLTGGLPYQGATAKEVLKQIREGPPRPILTVNPKASPALARITQDAMARELRDRFASMSDVLADLERVKAGQPPRGARGQVWLNTARQVLRATGAAVILVVLVVGIWNLWPRHQLKEVRAFSSPGVQEWQLAKMGDWQGTGMPALFIDDKAKNQLLVFSQKGEQIGSYSINAPGVQGLEVDLLADVWAPGATTRDGRDEVFLSWTQEGTDLRLVVLNQNLAAVKQFEAVGAGPSFRGGPGDVTHLRARLVTDLDCDGRRELLALINTGYEGQPRGLYCFDFESASLRWKRLVAPGVLELALFKLDSNGRQGVLLGTAAVSNNTLADDGSDDRHSYLYAYSDTGTVMWRSELGDSYTKTYPLVTDLDGDGQQELFAWVSAPVEYRTNEVGRIVQLDRTTGSPLPGRAYDAHARLLSCVSADLNGDHRNKILATDNRGFVHVLDAGLKCMRRTNIVPQRKDLGVSPTNVNFVDLQIIAITNLDSEPDLEVLLASQQIQVLRGLNPGLAQGEGNVRHAHDLSVHVLNAKLKPLAAFNLAPHWENASGWSVAVSNSGTNSSPQIFVFAKDKVRVLKYE